jgi:hypothetical protein
MPCSIAVASFDEGMIDIVLVDMVVTVMSNLNNVSRSRETFAFSSRDEV